jgi:hypothetical protein
MFMKRNELTVKRKREMRILTHQILSQNHWSKQNTLYERRSFSLVTKYNERIMLLHFVAL